MTFSTSTTPRSQDDGKERTARERVLPPLEPMLRRIAALIDGVDGSRIGELEDSELREALYPVTREYTYLNHAACGALSAPVSLAMTNFIQRHTLVGSLAVDEGEQTVERARERFARFIGAEPGTIAFTKNVSDGFMTVAAGLRWSAGDTIVTAACEFPANVYPWLNLQEQGVELRIAPTRDGRLAVEDVAALIDERTRIVSLSFVEFGTGQRNDLVALGRLAHEQGALFGVDGIQGLGALRLDVGACDIDFLATGSHKWLLGPDGGILYTHPRLLDQLGQARRGWTSPVEPFDFFNYAQPQRKGAARLEGGSNNLIPLIGLDAALAIFEAAEMEQVERRVLGLADLLREGLVERGHGVISPAGVSERSGVVAFHPHGVATIEGAEGTQDVGTLAGALATQERIVVSARNGAMRVSPHFYNTPEDIERFLVALERFV